MGSQQNKPDAVRLWLTGEISTGKLAELTGIERHKLEPLLGGIRIHLAEACGPNYKFVHPTHNEPAHDPDLFCWCSPLVDGDVMIHNRVTSVAWRQLQEEFPALRPMVAE